MNSRPDLPKLLLDNLLTAVILLDKHLIVRYVNPAAEQLMGLSARRLLDHVLFGRRIDIPDNQMFIQQNDSRQQIIQQQFW